MLSIPMERPTRYIHTLRLHIFGGTALYIHEMTPKELKDFLKRTNMIASSYTQLALHNSDDLLDLFLDVNLKSPMRLNSNNLERLTKFKEKVIKTLENKFDIWIDTGWLVFSENPPQLAVPATRIELFKALGLEDDLKCLRTVSIFQDNDEE